MILQIFKTIIFTIFTTYSTWAACPPLTERQIQDWNQKIYSGNSSAVYNCANKLYHMPREIWGESARALLLKVATRFLEIDNTLRTGGFIIWEDNSPRDFGELAGNLIELAAWQKDPRFIPFINEHIGTGLLAERGLELIGEPALETALTRLNKKHDGWSSQIGAIRVLEAWLKNQQPFLQNGEKRQLVKQRLLQVAQRSSDRSKRTAIEALQYINEPDVVIHLTAISRNELFANSVQARARAALEFMNRR